MFYHALAAAALLGHTVAGYLPSVQGTPEIIGRVDDPTINRDSCGSVRINSRVLWVCRDSQPYDAAGTPTLPVWSSSAAWSDLDSNGKLKLQQILSPVESGTGLLTYGRNTRTPFYPIPSDKCGSNSAGACPDGTRYAIWPDSPPLITSTRSDGTIVAYAWIKQAHITSNLGVLDKNPPTSLYRVEYAPTSDVNALPRVTLISQQFWSRSDFPYGNYGGVVRDGVAYIYGQNADGNVGVAQVPVDKIEDRSAYQFYIMLGWANSNPGVDASGLNIPNVSAGGQGTFYYSEVWKLFVWIGQAKNSVVPEFWISTSPLAGGPWEPPKLIYRAANGNGFIGGYTLQAHPSLLANKTENAIYLTYTKPMVNSKGISYYSNPLVYIKWQ
ncbi:hypothetical protein Micbo1qcDRAFT_232582 [Microdochium bolleyi]|uniref:DUF4185 domain-containing protein n=1 Tax=Microdochium bolleyi TaxID=196109 RepID=A0A136J721_9PEZI|nr:hypothetical protein Micbo1qcDRAFT_232582 [Microdochium bolleyi]